jgi:hypothetical protein
MTALHWELRKPDFESRNIVPENKVCLPEKVVRLDPIFFPA